MKTKEITQQLCTLLRREINVPVFEGTLPDGFSTACLVVKQELYDGVPGREEYHINVYVPNKLRILGSYVDRTYPDTDGIDALGDQVLAICEGFRRNFPDTKVHTRKYIQGGGMHYLDVCLWTSAFPFCYKGQAGINLPSKTTTFLAANKMTSGYILEE